MKAFARAEKQREANYKDEMKKKYEQKDEEGEDVDASIKEGASEAAEEEPV